MQRVVSFYEKLPRGAAPEVKPKGLLGRYQARYFGKNPSVARRFHPSSPTDFARDLADILDLIAIIHVIGALVVIGYAQQYYFHLRKLSQLSL